MKIESIRLKNFKSFKDVTMGDIPRFCVLVEANGAGKSTLFKVFEFLKEALSGNVHTALVKLGGNRGFREVRTRGAAGNIEIELKFRARSDGPLVTYSLSIGEEDSRPLVEREILKYRPGSGGQPWHFLDFSRGKGSVVTNELDLDLEKVTDVTNLKREEQTLKSSDILAIKGLAQFKRFPAVMALGSLIENWRISDFHINRARPEQEAGYAEHLSREGENLSLVTEYLYSRHKKVFQKILTKLSERVPGISRVDAKTKEGWVFSGQRLRRPVPGPLCLRWRHQDVRLSDLAL
uniref:AAA ATPase domain-containing protein n=1 Tax=Candidatus Kentrum sp. MB TaxID=2138164 RepID=A0A450XTM5_9GAMM|nr:MAG: AAA ATPase domain-containing protein [Candidatus Kentron sp. MB]